MFSTDADPAQHPQRLLVGAAVQWPIQCRHPGCDRRVGIHLGGADSAHGAGRAVLLVVGVQDEQDVQRALQPRIGLVGELGHLVHHRQEVARVVQGVVRIDVRLAHVVPEGERGQRGHLREQPDDLGLADVIVVDLVGVGVERREGAHRGHEHPHRVGVVAEALHEVLDVLVHERVDRDLVCPLGQLCCSRQSAVNQQVGDLQVSRVLAQLLDRIAAVLQDPGLAVDVGDRAATGGGVRVRRVVGHQAEVGLARLDLTQVHRPHGPVGDRQLVGAARAVVGHRQRVSGHSAVARCLLLVNLRLGAHLPLLSCRQVVRATP